MAHFYFDESIHVADGFILGAFVCFDDDPSDAVDACLTKAGLTPGVDEFKSSARMDVNQPQSQAREGLQRLAADGKVALVLMPEARRKELGLEALLALDKVLSANQIPGSLHDVFFDEGIVGDREKFLEEARRLGLDQRCNLYIGQDSVKVRGLQVADLVAHYHATMLRGKLGTVTKQIQKENIGFDGEELDLPFYLWACLRGSLFATSPVEDPVSGDINYTVDVVSMGGLHVAADCSSEVHDAALAEFGTDYLGCIH